MPVVTATEVTVYSNISASAATVAASGLIPVVQERIVQICNNAFATDLMVIATADFDASAGTITLAANDWETFGFADGDEIVIKNSYRNDGYKTVATVSSTIATLASTSTVVAELSARTILFAVVNWPVQVRRAAALMVAYDYDTRPHQTPGVKSYSLGPLSETFGEAGTGAFGYPEDILGSLPPPVVSMR